MSTFKQHEGGTIVLLLCLQSFLFSNNIRMFPRLKFKKNIKIDSNVNVTVVNSALCLFFICQIT